MIDETQTQLKTITSKIDVSFVLVSSQQNVYDEFVKYLNTIQTTSKKPSIPRQQNSSKIAYNEKSN